MAHHQSLSLPGARLCTCERNVLTTAECLKDGSVQLICLNGAFRDQNVTGDKFQFISRNELQTYNKIHFCTSIKASLKLLQNCPDSVNVQRYF